MQTEKKLIGLLEIYKENKHKTAQDYNIMASLNNYFSNHMNLEETVYSIKDSLKRDESLKEYHNLKDKASYEGLKGAVFIGVGIIISVTTSLVFTPILFDWFAASSVHNSFKSLVKTFSLIKKSPGCSQKTGLQKADDISSAIQNNESYIKKLVESYY